MADVLNIVSDINMLAGEKPEEFVCRAEERYDEILNSTVEKINSDEKLEIVLLAGPSSSGKTTTAKKLAEKLRETGHEAYTISLDDFYKNIADAIVDENGKRDFETVYALDLDLLKSVLTSILTTGCGEIPQYDFDTGRRKDDYFELRLNPGDVVIVEGLHALNPIISDSLPQEMLLKIYVSVSTRMYNSDGTVLMTKRDLRLIRRMVRDFQFRSSSVENTFSMWNDVLEGEKKYLAPYKFCADILIDSIHNYEPCVFKDEAIKLFSSVSSGSEWFNETQRLSKNLSRFDSLSPSIVPHSSLMREFLGNKM